MLKIYPWILRVALGISYILGARSDCSKVVGKYEKVADIPKSAKTKIPPNSASFKIFVVWCKLKLISALTGNWLTIINELMIEFNF